MNSQWTVNLFDYNLYAVIRYIISKTEMIDSYRYYTFLFMFKFIFL